MNLLKDMSKFNKLTTYNCLHISTKHNSVKTSYKQTANKVIS